MATEKIQSRSRDGLTLELCNTPKLLGHIKAAWAPQGMLASFKLETNRHILSAKARGGAAPMCPDGAAARHTQFESALRNTSRACCGAPRLERRSCSVAGDLTRVLRRRSPAVSRLYEEVRHGRGLCQHAEQLPPVAYPGQPPAGCLHQCGLRWRSVASEITHGAMTVGVSSFCNTGSNWPYCQPSVART